MGEIWDNLDAEFLRIYDLFRWQQSNISGFDFSNLPLKIQVGIRRLQEINESEKRGY